MLAVNETLLAIYREPARVRGLAPGDWTELLGAMRRARCMGPVATRLRSVGEMDALPDPVRGQFETAATLVEDRRHLVRWELRELAHALAGLDTPVVALKGAAYELQDLPLARGRLPSDVDLLVPAAHLAAAESRLRKAGWLAVDLDVYDERYYRDWSHEIPPMHHPERAIEVDLHHQITPAMTGMGMDFDRLWHAIRPCGEFHVLDPLDQVLHCAVHTFKDSDLGARLREVMDLDLLVRHFGSGDPDGFARALDARAQAFGVLPVWRLAARTASRWLATPVRGAPDFEGAMHGRWFDRWLDASMLPGPRQQPRAGVALIRSAMLARYHWHRMPLRRLVPHLIEKTRRRWAPGR